MNVSIRYMNESDRARIPSVEKDNPALKLYKSAGFEIVGTVGNAGTMRVAT